MQPGQVINPQSNKDNPPQSNAGSPAQPPGTASTDTAPKPPKTLDINSADSGKNNSTANTAASPKSPEDKIQVKNSPAPQAKKANPLSNKPATPSLADARNNSQAPKTPETPPPAKPISSDSNNTPPPAQPVPSANNNASAENAEQASTSAAENNKQQNAEANIGQDAKPALAANATEEATDFSRQAAETPIATSVSNNSSEPETNLDYSETIDKTPLLTWQAAEFTKHNHSPLWYLGAAAATVVIILVLILLPGSFGFQEWLSAVVVILMIVAFVLYARRNPRDLEYALTETGILIGGKHYSYSDFHAFAVLPYHGQMSIELDPLKRFMPRISLPASEQNLQQIEEVLSTRLPKSERKPDPIDKLTHYLKF